MINKKQDLIEYLTADKQALCRKSKRPRLNDYIWRYEILLRKCEYYQNINGNILAKAIFFIFKIRRNRLGIKCGFEIPLNIIDKGLCIAHYGPIIISEYAKIGQRCKIHSGVNIGADARMSNAAPCIGNDVYIGPGAKLFGPITIADRIAIGANAVVNHSFTNSDVSIGGVPAIVISNRGTKGILYNREENE